MLPNARGQQRRRLDPSRRFALLRNWTCADVALLVARRLKEVAEPRDDLGHSLTISTLLGAA